MTKVYIVRAESDGSPESVIAGLYPTEKLAKARVKALEDKNEWGWDYIWYDLVEVGSDGADCMLFNR